MVGMDPETGRLLSGLDRLRASIADILATPLGSRRERPDYSSRLPRMIDQPQTAGWIQAAQAEAGRAIKRWETSFAFERAGQQPQANQPGDQNHRLPTLVLFMHAGSTPLDSPPAPFPVAPLGSTGSTASVNQIWQSIPVGRRPI